MKVEVIEPHGPCAWVNAAISKALTLRNVYCLHALVHSDIVVDELRSLGFKFVERIEDVPRGETVVFSAHGVPPQVREVAAARGLKVVDMTCPSVARVHRAAKRFSDRGLPVVVLGDREHAEVKGIAGEVDTPPPRPGDRIGVVSQTTMVPARFDALCALLEARIPRLRVEATICPATRDRQREAAEIAARSDVMLVIGGRESSNSRKLYRLASDICPRTFFIETA